MPYKDKEKQREAVRLAVQKGRVQKKITETVTLIKETVLDEQETQDDNYDFTLNREKYILKECMYVFNIFVSSLKLSTDKCKNYVDHINYTSKDYMNQLERLIQDQIVVTKNSAAILDMLLLHPGVSDEDKPLYIKRRSQYDRIIKGLEEKYDLYLEIKGQGQTPYIDKKECEETQK